MEQKNTWKYATFALLGVLVLAVVIILLNRGNVTGNVVADKSGLGATGGSATVSIDDDPMLGSKSAQITIIEFSDFQCPFCRKANSESIDRLRAEYVDTGKVNIVFRDFPLASIHPAAIPSAMAVNCVREQGGDEAFWKMHDKIFMEQNILDGGSASSPVTKTVVYTAEDLKNWAQEIGYDISSCLDSNKYYDEIQKDLADGQAAGVRGTPAFFINNKLISGAQPYAVFKAEIDNALA